MEPLGPLPAVGNIQSILDTAFWASLLREEHSSPKVSLAFLSPAAKGALQFEQAIPFTPQALSRLAPAVEGPGLHLGIWCENGHYVIWGVTRLIPPFSLVVEVVEPGLLVVKHSRSQPTSKFTNMAVLEGNRVKLLDHDARLSPHCPTALLSMVRFDASDSSPDYVNVLVELAVSIRAHGRGGSLLIVPAGNETWRESIVQPIAYSVSPPFAKIAYLLQRDPAEREGMVWQKSLDRTIETIAGLTAVDGATLITENYEVLAFGGKIGRRDGLPPVHQVMVTEPLIGAEPQVVHPSMIGGTRHLSAAQFVQDQQDALALVASQDGRFTVFAWSGCDGMVHAHSVESMLL